MPQDDKFDELSIPPGPSETGIENLDRIAALEARVLALEALVEMLVGRDVDESDDDPERYVDRECSALFGRMMFSEGWVSAADTDVANVAETIATNLIERNGRAKQRRNSH
ncbi:hypothetical protein KEU06_17580 [Pseudaminobacter sp. 19-2017]|uniref:Uncharacterized protein n=1 Tax=Pseudaminobacter soli (ex Zhang et al. 2022) TaxID=2831468 RepID=A0A942DYQ4_9HYPH|nr:hypothetical protein [Pseudaminobacter soli]MBS3650429.1 hypothetical protein [Pseudaminobacter soli]